MQPGQCPFDDPAGSAESAAVGCPPLRELRLDPAVTEQIAMRLRIVAPVALNERRLVDGRAGAPPQRWNAIDQWDQLGHVVPIGRGHNGGQGNALRLGENVMFRPRLTAIGWVRSSFFPPRSARTEALSTIARARSSWPRWRN